jgi:hypothetical protein
VATFLATGVLILQSFTRYVDHLLSSSPEWQLLPIHDVVQSELSTDVGGIAYSAIWWGVAAAIWYGGFDIVGNASQLLCRPLRDGKNRVRIVIKEWSADGFP